VNKMNLKQKSDDIHKSKKRVVIMELALSFGSRSLFGNKNAEFLQIRLQQYVNKHNNQKILNDNGHIFKNDGLNWGA